MYHPEVLKLVSQASPVSSTHANASKGSSAIKVKESFSKIGRGEGAMLPYRIMEPYFQALMRLLPQDTITLSSLFGLLETSDTYRPMFSLTYSTLCVDGKYIAMNEKVTAVFKNDTSVKIGSATVCVVFVTLFNSDRSIHPIPRKSKP